MREDQADQIIDLLSDIAFDVKTLREDFEKFSGYGVDSMAAVSERIVDSTDNLSSLGEQIVDGLTGSFRGIGGVSLEDIKSAIEDQ